MHGSLPGLNHRAGLPLLGYGYTAGTNISTLTSETNQAGSILSGIDMEILYLPQYWIGYQKVQK